MATLVLSAVGLAVGGSVSGSVLGLSTAVVGRAVGATLGRVIDQRLLGAGSDPVETGRIDRFRLTGASEGAPVQGLYGRMRLPGQIIWASRFQERARTTGGGKGAPSAPATTSYSYSVNLAVALCAGEITRVGRIWADGVELARDSLTLRVYPGDEAQRPDPKIEAIEGAGNVPAYRGTAYVVLEDLELGQFGNRIPQFSFEVVRPGEPDRPEDEADIARLIRGVALIPGTGEYALATTPIYRRKGYGEMVPINVNTPSGQTDFATSLETLVEELPRLNSVSLVVSWFGSDLRCAQCAVQPKVEQADSDPAAMPWVVSGVPRGSAAVVPTRDGRVVYGGTPADASVIEAIRALKATGKETVFYPFVLMDQLAGNGLPDPWSGVEDQPVLPWRGRITLSVAPGRSESPDGSADAAGQVAAFFGDAMPSQFSATGSTVAYSGPAEWSYRRFILHYATLCAMAGGVSAFCIGSELRSLTQIRGGDGKFPAVEALRALAADVRAILGPECRIGYAADWSEYHGYQPPGTGDKLFHLDPLWADPNVDFIGIDNYMPLSDWRDGLDHRDAGWGSIYSLDYLRANVAGGEGFDWYYHSPEARDAQIRTPIADAWGEDWVWRYKDIAGWWGNPHHERVGGVRSDTATAWEPRSKPIWFTEFGCPAIDKGTNEPNKFVDVKSSESGLPHYSDGRRDELIQVQYIRAIHAHFADPAFNPVSEVYGGPMVDLSRAHVWAWDARPYPFFPANTELWSDGGNYLTGHWLNGRTSARTLAGVVREICADAGQTAVDTSRLHGLVRGYSVDAVQTARATLQPLMLAHGFDAIERDGVLSFVTRTERRPLPLLPEAVSVGDDVTIEAVRAAEAEVSGRVQVGFVDADGDYSVRSAEAVFADEETLAVAGSDLPMALTRGEGRALAERWLAESRVARDTLRFGLPPSRLDIGAGDLVSFADGAVYRIDRVEQAEDQKLEAVRVEPSIYIGRPGEEDATILRAFSSPVPLDAVMMDLPLIRGDEVPHATYFAATAVQWPGSVALYSAPHDNGYALNGIYPQAAAIGVTETGLARAAPGRWDRGPRLRVRLARGQLAAVSLADLLSGANIAAVGDGSPDAWELLQFADAELVGPQTYEVGMRLRGQFGSDGVAPADWPEGSLFVLMNGVPSQIDLPANARDVLQHYRFGPAQRPIDDPSYQHLALAFRGNGLRPYAPCHLRVDGLPGADLSVSWVRRTRIDGDSWSGVEVPLGEAVEAYEVRILQDGVLRRRVEVGEPRFDYPAALRVADQVSGAFRIEVAQLSDRYGPGPAASMVVTG